MTRRPHLHLRTRWHAARRFATMPVVSQALALAAYGSLIVVGLLGFVSPSLTVEQALPDRYALLTWTVTYVLAGGSALATRLAHLPGGEGGALLLLSFATFVHAVALIAGGPAGHQTGGRMLAGILIVILYALTRFEVSRRADEAAAAEEERAALISVGGVALTDEQIRVQVRQVVDEVRRERVVE